MWSYFRSFWKEDFHNLKHQGEGINECLRKDESMADITDRIETGHNRHSHLYFEDPQQPPPFRHVRTNQIPPEIRQDIENKQHIRMGLAPKALIAWIVVDRSVYLWSFKEQDSFVRIDAPEEQFILAAGIVPPNRGKYICL